MRRQLSPLQQFLASLMVIGLIFWGSLVVQMVRNLTIAREEHVLQNDLFNLRGAISEYTLDRKTPPTSLEELVTRGYLRTIPVDPFTGNNQWRTAVEDESRPGILGEIPQPTFTVHSTSQKQSLKGDAYSRW